MHRVTRIGKEPDDCAGPTRTENDFRRAALSRGRARASSHPTGDGPAGDECRWGDLPRSWLSCRGLVAAADWPKTEQKLGDGRGQIAVTISSWTGHGHICAQFANVECAWPRKNQGQFVTVERTWKDSGRCPEIARTFTGWFIGCCKDAKPGITRTAPGTPTCLLRDLRGVLRW